MNLKTETRNSSPAKLWTTNSFPALLSTVFSFLDKCLEQITVSCKVEIREEKLNVFCRAMLIFRSNFTLSSQFYSFFHSCLNSQNSARVKQFSMQLSQSEKAHYCVCSTFMNYFLHKLSHISFSKAFLTFFFYRTEVRTRFNCWAPSTRCIICTWKSHRYARGTLG